MGGCAVRTLKEHGPAKREAEAEADPGAFYGNYFGYNNYYGLNGLYNGYYPYSYGAYPYGVNSLWNYAALGRGYATGFEQFEGYPAATAPLPAVQVAPLPAAPLPVVRHPVVTPIVKRTSKPVTYTHLGAHPIQPTTVFEESQEIVGHHVF